MRLHFNEYNTGRTVSWVWRYAGVLGVRSQVDIIARALGRDPMDLRLQNLKDLGETYVPGESGLDSDMRAGLNLVADRIGYKKRKRVYGCGMGLSVGFKDAGGVK